MKALTIKNLPDALVTTIERRAAERGLTVDEEVRRLLQDAYTDDRRHQQRWARAQQDRLDREELEPVDDAVLIERLRETLSTSIGRGGVVTDQDLDDALARKSAELRKEGY